MILNVPKRKLFWVGGLTVSILLVAAYVSFYSSLVRVEHLVFHPVDDSESGDSMGDTNRDSERSKYPTVTIIKRDEYVLTIHTPINTEPVVFLKVEKNNEGHDLQLIGPHLKELPSGSGSYLEGYRYSFLVRSADGDALELQIADEHGAIVGREILPYDIKVRDYIWAIDAL